MSEKTIFQKILDGEIPAHKVYEDEYFLAFLDIFPKSAGHTLVIPKQATQWVWDIERYHEYMQLVQKIAKALQKAFHVEMVRMEVYGEQVPHAHVHVWPRVEKDGSEKDFDMIVERIKMEL